MTYRSKSWHRLKIRSWSPSILSRCSVQSKSPHGPSLPSFVTASQPSQTGSKGLSSSLLGFASLKPFSNSRGDLSCQRCSSNTPGNIWRGPLFERDGGERTLLFHPQMAKVQLRSAVLKSARRLSLLWRFPHARYHRTPLSPQRRARRLGSCLLLFCYGPTGVRSYFLICARYMVTT